MSKIKENFINEIDKIPEEFLPNLLLIIRTFRESVTLKSAETSFKQGLKEAEKGMTRPVSELWNTIDTE